MPAGGPRRALHSFVELIGWAVVAVVGTIALTQAFGWTGLLVVAIVQSLTPYLALLLAPIALIALWRRRLYLATACSAIGLGILILAAPLAFPDDQPEPIADAVGLRVASVNLLYSNDRVDDVASTLHDLGPDVIVFNEYTSGHQSSLEGSPLADDYPYRTDRTDRYAGGIAVWSREPVTDRRPSRHLQPQSRCHRRRSRRRHSPRGAAHPDATDQLRGLAARPRHGRADRA